MNKIKFDLNEIEALLTNALNEMNNRIHPEPGTLNWYTYISALIIEALQDLNHKRAIESLTFSVEFEPKSFSDEPGYETELMHRFELLKEAQTDIKIMLMEIDECDQLEKVSKRLTTTQFSHTGGYFVLVGWSVLDEEFCTLLQNNANCHHCNFDWDEIHCNS